MLYRAALVVLILLSSASAIPLLSPQKALAFEDEGYIKFIVSKVNESNGNNNNTNEVQLPEAAKGPAIPPKGYLVEESFIILLFALLLKSEFVTVSISIM